MSRKNGQSASSPLVQRSSTGRAESGYAQSRQGTDAYSVDRGEADSSVGSHISIRHWGHLLPPKGRKRSRLISAGVADPASVMTTGVTGGLPRPGAFLRAVCPNSGGHRCPWPSGRCSSGRQWPPEAPLSPGLAAAARRGGLRSSQTLPPDAEGNAAQRRQGRNQRERHIRHSAIMPANLSPPIPDPAAAACRQNMPHGRCQPDGCPMQNRQ
jgi:hypothetical protein